MVSSALAPSFAAASNLRIFLRMSPISMTCSRIFTAAGGGTLVHTPLNMTSMEAPCSSSRTRLLNGSMVEASFNELHPEQNLLSGEVCGLAAEADAERIVGHQDRDALGAHAVQVNRLHLLAPQ